MHVEACLVLLGRLNSPTEAREFVLKIREILADAPGEDTLKRSKESFIVVRSGSRFVLQSLVAHRGIPEAERRTYTRKLIMRASHPVNPRINPVVSLRKTC